MREVALDDVRSLSACLFGSRYRLELLAAFAEAPQGRVNLGRLAESRGVQAAVYYPSVRDLLAAGLVRRARQISADRRRWYERAGGDELWEPLARLAEQAHDHFNRIGGADAGRPDTRERVGA